MALAAAKAVVVLAAVAAVAAVAALAAVALAAAAVVVLMTDLQAGVLATSLQVALVAALSAATTSAQAAAIALVVTVSAALATGQLAALPATVAMSASRLIEASEMIASQAGLTVKNREMAPQNLVVVANLQAKAAGANLAVMLVAAVRRAIKALAVVQVVMATAAV